MMYSISTLIIVNIILWYLLYELYGNTIKDMYSKSKHHFFRNRKWFHFIHTAILIVIIYYTDNNIVWCLYAACWTGWSMYRIYSTVIDYRSLRGSKWTRM